ncbi:hypothetical protein OH492_08610 [Vibrio chagasii]|nr:hypothetical protein [Vibrio chagasii]
MIGLGLLESIHKKRFLASRSSKLPADNQGVTGKANYVLDVSEQLTRWRWVDLVGKQGNQT